MNWHVFALTLLRAGAGLMLAQHGYQKLFGLAGSGPVELMSQRGLGGVIEFFGGLLVAIGLGTRWAAFICSGTMAVAFWQFHAFRPEAWEQNGALALLPIINRGELAALYCFVFFFLWAHGGGPVSVDAQLRRNRN